MARLAQTLGMAVIAVALSACGGKRDAVDDRAKKDYDASEGGGLNVAALIGTSKNPPDEFAVIAKRPLELPKDFAALPAPQPGARSLRDPDPIADARTALLGESAVTAASTRTSASEAALLNSLTTPDAASVQASLAANEAAVETDDQSYLIDRALGAQDRRGLIDPTAERERIAAARSAPAALGAAETSAPIATTATIPTPAPAAIPSAPVTNGELIYIPE